ncbi:transmembrane protein, putative (macronuclear) [Tetrahymena thermophila SB210]|uniref:Transmembrane protein, putative n=1 Tax=Tetrahymena thermophila (strain SB210) TaxID=312017 RepID=W7XGE3_TETTS|nr:transmembrane protein, putative [Tetrahymena thermophila SB210]EWS73191.1 transmembrane protein, putative [Tetrahymena thermophila SB210]|eukprot:XP_012654267.1 transmembrane protein, putative [Tetrahymena thermophila SB210]
MCVKITHSQFVHQLLVFQQLQGGERRLIQSRLITLQPHVLDCNTCQFQFMSQITSLRSSYSWFLFTRRTFLFADELSSQNFSIKIQVSIEQYSSTSISSLFGRMGGNAGPPNTDVYWLGMSGQDPGQVDRVLMIQEFQWFLVELLLWLLLFYEWGYLLACLIVQIYFIVSVFTSRITIDKNSE